VAKRSRSVSVASVAASAKRFAVRLMWLAALCAAVWASVAGYREVSPRVRQWTEIRHIRVAGLDHVTRDEVVERLRIGSGVSLVTINVDSLAEGLQRHPWIKTADVTREWPHTLTVRITERRPAALVRGDAETLLVDDEGVALSAVADDEAPALPVLQGVDPVALREAEPGARRSAQVGIRLAAVLGRSFSGLPEIDVHDPGNAVAYVGGLRFQFGPSAFDEKWDRYRKLEPHLAGASPDGKPGFNEVDLRYSGKVIVRDRAAKDVALARERG
jgi:cell division protein FtsQ